MLLHLMLPIWYQDHIYANVYTLYDQEFTRIIIEQQGIEAHVYEHKQ